MIIPKEILKITSIIDNQFILVYIAILLILMYLIIGLLTWSFIKPLKYLGIPTSIVGLLLIIIRFIPDFYYSVSSSSVNIKKILPSILKPVLVYGILCFLLGIIMIVIYIIINKRNKNKIINNK